MGAIFILTSKESLADLNLELFGLDLVFTCKLLQAASTLQKIGRAETDVLARRKTQLSLGKLAALAAEEEENTLLEQLDQDLLLVEAQVQFISLFHIGSY